MVRIDCCGSIVLADQMTLMMLAKLVCRAFGHRSNRRRVWHDDLDYRTHRSRCEAERYAIFMGGRKFDPERDADLLAGHPGIHRMEGLCPHV